MVKKFLIVGFIVGLLSSLGYAETGQQEIFIDEGSFLFKNLSLTSKYGAELRGDITNNTTKDWFLVDFKVELYDKSGRKYEDNFYISSIEKGETKSIDKTFYSFPKNLSSSTYKIYFVSGKYETSYTFTMVKPKESDSLTLEDNFINIQFLISGDESKFILKNKTDNPIRIDWDQVSYVDIFGESHRVIHSGVRYIERDKLQAPTVVPPTAKVKDVIISTSCILKDDHWGLVNTRLFPRGLEAKPYKGKIFSIFMPLEINGAIKNYLFSFKIVDVEF